MPFGLGQEFVFRSGDFVRRVFSGHFDVSAERKRADAVVCFASPEPEKPRTEPDRKRLDPDLEELGDRKVAKLMNDNDDPEDNQRPDDIGQHAANREPASRGRVHVLKCE